MLWFEVAPKINKHLVYTLMNKHSFSFLCSFVTCMCHIYTVQCCFHRISNSLNLKNKMPMSRYVWTALYILPDILSSTYCLTDALTLTVLGTDCITIKAWCTSFAVVTSSVSPTVQTLARHIVALVEDQIGVRVTIAITLFTGVAHLHGVAIVTWSTSWGKREILMLLF